VIAGNILITRLGFAIGNIPHYFNDDLDIKGHQQNSIALLLNLLAFFFPYSKFKAEKRNTPSAFFFLFIKGRIRHLCLLFLTFYKLIVLFFL